MNNSALPVHLTSECEATIVKIGFYFERHKKKFQLNAKEFNLDATKIVKQLENADSMSSGFGLGIKNGIILVI